MLFYLGVFLIIGSIVTGFLCEGGNILVLFQPYAALIILGSALGILLLSTPKPLLKSMLHILGRLRKGIPYSREDYILLLTFMFYFFRNVRTTGVINIEADIEKPYTSMIFNEFPSILHNTEALTFFCDYMRMFVSGFDKSFELERLMDEQISVRRHYNYEITHVLFKLADALPALGIIAAVLGVINAMSSIDAEPAVLGHKIAAALIGTFIGVAASYCVITPLGSYIDNFTNDEAKFLECMRAGFISFVNGNPPAIAVEFARQTIPVNLKPGFIELEHAIEMHKQTRKTRKYARRDAS